MVFNSSFQNSNLAGPAATAPSATTGGTPKPQQTLNAQYQQPTGFLVDGKVVNANREDFLFFRSSRDILFKQTGAKEIAFKFDPNTDSSMSSRDKAVGNAKQGGIDAGNKNPSSSTFLVKKLSNSGGVNKTGAGLTATSPHNKTDSPRRAKSESPRSRAAAMSSSGASPSSSGLSKNKSSANIAGIYAKEEQRPKVDVEAEWQRWKSERGLYNTPLGTPPPGNFQLPRTPEKENDMVVHDVVNNQNHSSTVGGTSSMHDDIKPRRGGSSHQEHQPALGAQMNQSAHLAAYENKPSTPESQVSDAPLLLTNRHETPMDYRRNGSGTTKKSSPSNRERDSRRDHLKEQNGTVALGADEKLFQAARAERERHEKQADADKESSSSPPTTASSLLQAVAQTLRLDKKSRSKRSSRNNSGAGGHQEQLQQPSQKMLNRNRSDDHAPYGNFYDDRDDFLYDDPENNEMYSRQQSSGALSTVALTANLAYQTFLQALQAEAARCYNAKSVAQLRMRTDLDKKLATRNLKSAIVPQYVNNNNDFDFVRDRFGFKYVEGSHEQRPPPSGMVMSAATTTGVVHSNTASPQQQFQMNNPNPNKFYLNERSPPRDMNMMMDQHLSQNPRAGANMMMVKKRQQLDNNQRQQQYNHNQPSTSSQMMQHFSDFCALNIFWQSWFETLCCVVVVLNMLSLLVEYDWPIEQLPEPAHYAFRGLDLTFFILYHLEFLLRCNAQDWKNVCSTFPGFFDLIILVLAWSTELIVPLVLCEDGVFTTRTQFAYLMDHNYYHLFAVLYLLRLVRILRLFTLSEALYAGTKRVWRTAASLVSWIMVFFTFFTTATLVTVAAVGRNYEIRGDVAADVDVANANAGTTSAGATYHFDENTAEDAIARFSRSSSALLALLKMVFLNSGTYDTQALFREQMWLIFWFAGLLIVGLLLVLNFIADFFDSNRALPTTVSGAANKPAGGQTGDQTITLVAPGTMKNNNAAKYSTSVDADEVLAQDQQALGGQHTGDQQVQMFGSLEDEVLVLTEEFQNILHVLCNDTAHWEQLEAHLSSRRRSHLSDNVNGGAGPSAVMNNHGPNNTSAPRGTTAGIHPQHDQDLLNQQVSRLSFERNWKKSPYLLHILDEILQLGNSVADDRLFDLFVSKHEEVTDATAFLDSYVKLRKFCLDSKQRAFLKLCATGNSRYQRVLVEMRK
ncbi:unnamed protein product [Amoebophrya sp. A120]|nr:unnamed protein product [Amoebophrya sp. A120]|eukprot:GSA120T00003758001.1